MSDDTKKTILLSRPFQMKDYHGIKLGDAKALLTAEAKRDVEAARAVAVSVTYETIPLRRSNRIAGREGYLPVDNRVITATDIKKSIAPLRNTTNMPSELSDIIARYAEPTRKWKWIREPGDHLREYTAHNRERLRH